MNRLLIFIGMTVGGYVGWWAGDYRKVYCRFVQPCHGLPVRFINASLPFLTAYIRHPVRSKNSNDAQVL